MDTISFKLDAFEGPLDLLLHLVSKHKLNIYDIEISLLLEQYLLYIEGIETRDYEQAADFLEMAARLIYIKTCYLLPQPEEAEELKRSLQGRMIEYSLCKWAAQRLREDYAGGTIFVRAPVKLPVNKQYTRLHDKQELYEAYMMISAKVKEYKPLRANMFSPIVARRIVSVESKITEILERLYTKGSFEMSHLYDGMEERSERIAAFLAVLELTKSGRIFLNDDNTLIELRRPQSEGDADTYDDAQGADDTDNTNNTDDTDYTEDEPAYEEDALKDTAEEVLEAEDASEMSEDGEAEHTEASDMAAFAEAVSDEQDSTAAPDDEPEEDPPAAKDKPVKSYSMQLAQSAHTVTLRVDEPVLSAEEVGEFVSLFDEPAEDFIALFDERGADDEPEAVAVFAPIAFPEPPKQEAHDDTDEQATCDYTDEPYRAAFKPNYYARRYYWGSAPLADGRRSFRAAWNMRI